MTESKASSRRYIGRIAAGLLLLAIPASAEGPVLHEFFEVDPAEDLALQATTQDGAMPAALATPRGPVRAPSAQRDPFSAKASYGGSATPSSPDATYRIDRNTKRPDVVSYDEPFSPSIAPFKRLYASDSVSPSLELRVAEQALSTLSIGGGLAPSEDAFYADMFVDLVAGTAVRIPSVGPSARVLVANTEPKVSISIVTDGAENWFVQAKESRRVRLLMQLAVDRNVFGSAFGDVPWEVLRLRAPAFPAALRDEVRATASLLGVRAEETPKQVLARMVAYFRGFAPSNEPLQAGSSLELYRELTRSRHGVCRHRAYAFVVTALGLGIPARFIRNEAHAWVEVFDTRMWHRIDLGGAAGQLDFDQEGQVATYAPPPDPYLWPEGSQSGQSMLSGAAQSSHSGNASSGNAAPSTGSAPLPAPSADAATADSLPQARLELTVKLPAAIQRGEAVVVAGALNAEGNPCPNARVDIYLKSAEASAFVGSLATGENGKFEGSVVVPRSLTLGDYVLLARSSATATCKSASSE